MTATCRHLCHCRLRGLRGLYSVSLQAPWARHRPVPLQTTVFSLQAPWICSTLLLSGTSPPRTLGSMQTSVFTSNLQLPSACAAFISRELRCSSIFTQFSLSLLICPCCCCCCCVVASIFEAHSFPSDPSRFLTRRRLRDSHGLWRASKRHSALRSGRNRVGSSVALLRLRRGRARTQDWPVRGRKARKPRTVTARKMRPEKSVRVEVDGGKGRKGVKWRPSRRRYAVEVRLPQKVAGRKLKLHLGSTYGSLEEANVARDYAALVRNSTGKEDPAKVGGFRNPHDHPSIFEFKESPEIFESLEGSGYRAGARCDEYKRLLELQTPEAWKKFNAAAREDILIAIEVFRSIDPERFPPPPSKRSSNAVPVHDGEIHRTPPPSSSEVRVSPTPGREVGASMGEGSTSSIGIFSLVVQITVIGSPFQAQLPVNVPGLTAKEFFVITKAGLDRIQRELIDKGLEGREVGASTGEGSTSFIGALSLEVQITVIDSPFQARLHMNVPGLTAEEIFMITKAGIDRIQRELIDKWLEELGPCTVEPVSFPFLE